MRRLTFLFSRSISSGFLASMLAATLIAFLLASCGSGKQSASTYSSSQGTGTVSFSAEWQAPPEGASRILAFPRAATRSSAARPLAPAIDVCVDYMLEWVDMEVWNGSVRVARETFACSDHTGTLLNVPAGDNLSFRMYGRVSGYTVPFWQLQPSVSFSLSPGEEKPLGRIAMSWIGPSGVPPWVESFSPDNNATGLPATTAIRFTLSEPMAWNTVNDNAAVRLVDSNSTRIPGRIVYDNASLTAVFHPSVRLAAGGRYSVTLASSLTDRSGQAMESPYTSNFYVYAPGRWDQPRMLETNIYHAQLPSIAVDNNGNAIAVWEQSDGTRYHIWANRYTRSGGWGTATQIENDTVNPSSSPHVAMDFNGNAIAVWDHFDGTRYNVWSSRYTPSGGWGTPAVIETDSTGNASAPKVAIDGSGNAVAVWHQHDGIRGNIRANRYTPSGGWGVAELIETDNAGSATFPQVAVDGSGNAVAVWYQSDGVRTNIWANRYTPSGGWGTAALIETDDTGNALLPRVAMDDSGNAVAVWQQFDAVRSNIWANRYTTSGGWGVAELVETDNAGHAFGPEVAMTGSGDAVAVWYQHDGVRYNIWAKRYTPSGGWGTAELIETNNDGNANSPEVAIDADGNAVVVWSQDDWTRTNVWANRYSPSAGWGVAELIETDNAGNASSPKVAMNGSGFAVAVWHQFDSARNNVWSNRYTTFPDWSTASRIETNGGGGYPRVATDGSGNAVAVWVQWDGARGDIWANRYTLSGGWGTPALIETNTVQNANGPQVAMDRNGNAVAVWYQNDGTRTNIWSNRFTLSGGWGTAVLIETNAGYTYDPVVAMDGSGNAIAVWRQYDGTRENIWANRYSSSGGWGTATLIENGAGTASSPHVAMDGSGNAIAVWSQSDGTRNNIWANRYTPAGGWGTPALIESDNAGSAYGSRVAMDGSGNAVAVWYQSDGTRENIWANRYTPSGGWGTAALIESDNAGSARFPQVAVDGIGNAVAVWYQNDGTRDNIWANRYTPSVGWGTAALIETDNAGSAGDPQVAMDGSGTAVAVWSQSDGSRVNIWANRCTPSGGWGTAALVETDAGSAGIPDVAMDGSGNAVAVWYQVYGSQSYIWANRYY